MCELKGPNCKGDSGLIKTYTCEYCCKGDRREVTCCDACYRELYQKKSLICQKPGCVEHTDEILQRRAEAKQREKAETEARRKKEAEDRLGAETVTAIDNLGKDFPNNPTPFQAGPVQAAAGKQDVRALLAAAKAAKWTSSNIPGTNADQMFEIFYFAFSRGWTV